MLDRNDELELLGLIEGELDAPAEAALRKRLAKEPKALRAIASMKDDRAALRSIAEPELPTDFLVQIESLLARPMLMEGQPSPALVNPNDLRKQHRRQTRRIRWDRLTVAAAILLGVPAGIWAFSSGLLRFNPKPLQQIAMNDPAATSGVGESLASSGRSAIDNRALTAADGIIHHDHPIRWPASGDRANEPTDSHFAVDATADGNANANAVAAVRHVLVADFEIVLLDRSGSDAEQAVQRAVTSLGDQGALVRNFSFAEAARLEQDWRLAQRGGDGSTAPMVAGLGSTASNSSAEIKKLADRVRAQLTTAAIPGEAVSGARPVENSRQLVGTKELAPSLEQQLDFSSRGSVMTVTVPAAQLQTFIEQLSLAENQNAALRMLPARMDQSRPDGTDEAELIPPALLWIVDGPKVRASIERLSRMGASDVVLVPVSVGR